VEAHQLTRGREDLKKVDERKEEPKVYSPAQSETGKLPEIAIKVIWGNQTSSATPAESVLPEKILFGALNDPEFQLIRPILLNVVSEESSVVLSWDEVNEFSVGSTLGEALDDFGQTVRELYRYLHRHDVKLGADLEEVKRILGEYIQPRQQ
jgi:hypothetical protein